MGCTCTRPLTQDSATVPVHVQQRQQLQQFHRQQQQRQTLIRKNVTVQPPFISEHSIPPQDLLQLCKEIMNKHFNDDMDPVMLATLCIMESRGCAELVVTEKDTQQSRAGLCQLQMSRYLYLYKDKNFNAFGEPTISKVKDPRMSLYFGAARIQTLMRHNGQKHDEEFVVRNFRNEKRKNFSNANINYQETCEKKKSNNQNNNNSGNTCINLSESGGGQMLWMRYCSTKRKMSQLYRALQRVEKREDSDPEEVMHVIREGENISKIANMCMLDVADIMALNSKINNPEYFRPGDCISIPISKTIPKLYAGRKGELIASIARRNSLTLGRLLKANPDILDTEVSYNGQLLRIPGIRGDSQSSLTQGTIPKESGMLLTCLRGETIQSICEQFQVRARDVVVLNDLDDWAMTRKGQRIFIPDNVLKV